MPPRKFSKQMPSRAPQARSTGEVEPPQTRPQRSRCLLLRSSWRLGRVETSREYEPVEEMQQPTQVHAVWLARYCHKYDPPTQAWTRAQATEYGVVACLTVLPMERFLHGVSTNNMARICRGTNRIGKAALRGCRRAFGC
jgi:hypothetical protein